MSNTFRLRQRPPLPALILAALLALVGMGLLLAASLTTLQWLLILGLTVVGLAVALFVIVVWRSRTRTLTVRLDSAGYRVEAGGSAEQGQWAGVKGVTRGPDRITLHLADGAQVQLQVPRSNPAELDGLGAEIARLLDADRGYRN